ncbi:MAG: acyl-CoA dehydrogenase family protein [Actinobacteria bacterium]|nr:acyl-CoA dehydrogenase family protein [Actinomycetota bacterium]
MERVIQAARFVREQVRPHLDEWEREGRYPREAVRGSGLTGLFSPKEFGGLDLSYPEGVAVFEELGRGDAALAFSLSMHNAVAAAITRQGDGELRDRWGTRLVAGEALGGFSLTEPEAGSDATAITTRAVETASGWRVTGRKAWVSLAGEGDLFLVVCKTSHEPGHRDIAMLAVEREGGGVGFPTIYRKATADFLPIGEMELDGAPGRVLAPPGMGMRAALGAIDVARCDIAAIANGLHAEAIDVALRYGRDRQVFGQRVIDHQGIQWALTDAATDLEAGRLLTRRAAELLGTPEGSVAVAHAKRFGPDAALRAAILASEVLGAYGWLQDYPLTRFMALAKMLQVVDGTAEIQRVVIARDLVRRAEGL